MKAVASSSAVTQSRSGATTGQRHGRGNQASRWWLVMAAPMSVTASACVALAVAPAIVGFSAAVGAAFAWVWWLERHQDPESRSSSVLSLMASDPPQGGSPDAALRGPQSPPLVSAHRVLVCLPPHAPANLEIRSAARLADRLGGSLMAAYVMTERPPSKRERDGRATDDRILATNISLAKAVGATVVQVRAEDISDGLVALNEREGFTHAVFGHSGGLGDLLASDSVIAGFVSRSRGVEIEVIKRPGTA